MKFGTVCALLVAVLFAIVAGRSGFTQVNPSPLPSIGKEQLFLFSTYWKREVTPGTAPDYNNNGVIDFHDLVILLKAPPEPTPLPTETPVPPTATQTPTSSPTVTPTPTGTATPTLTPTHTSTATITPTASIPPTSTPEPVTPTPTDAETTPTATEPPADVTPTPTDEGPSGEATPTATLSSDATTPTPTETGDVVPTNTPNDVPGGTATPGSGSTPLPGSTPTPTQESSPNNTPTPNSSGSNPTATATQSGGTATTPTPVQPVATPTPVLPQLPTVTPLPPSPIRQWNLQRPFKLFNEPVHIPSAAHITASSQGYAVFTYSTTGSPRYISFDRLGRIFRRTLSISMEESSNLFLTEGGNSFGQFFENLALTRRFWFEQTSLDEVISEAAIQIDHLDANDFQWTFAGSPYGFAMVVFRFPDIIRVSRIDPAGNLLGVTEIQTPIPLPEQMPWAQAEFSGTTLLIAYPLQSSGIPAGLYLLDLSGEVYSESPYTVPFRPVNQAIAGDDNHTFFILHSTNVGNRLTRVGREGILFERQLPFSGLEDIEWSLDTLWGLDEQQAALFGFDEDGNRVQGPVSIFPPGWTDSLLWLELRKSSNDLGAFFTNPDQPDSVHYMQIEAGPLVTPTPTPASGAPTGATESIELATGVVLDLVQIPAGTYSRGASPNDLDARPNESPSHTVNITQPFFISRTEITNGMYRLFKPNHRSAGTDRVELDADNLPVVQVSWNDANEFCEWLSRETGLEFSLPTEAEWEYACRAGTTTRRYYGDDPDNVEGCQMMNAADISTATDFNFPTIFPCDDGFRGPAPVGSFPPNSYGIHDLLGNVWEWCDDWFVTYTDSPQIDPTGPQTGFSKIIRGGSWQEGPVWVRSSIRTTFAPDQAYEALGFRVVLRRSQ